jgi:hypothetical protein
MFVGLTPPRNRNEYQDYLWGGGGGKGGLCVGLAFLPPPCVDCQKSSEPQPSGALGPYLGMYSYSFTLYNLSYKVHSKS